MILTYRPDGGGEQQWEFVPRKMRRAEAEMLEKRTGWTWEEFGVQIIKGSVLARHALLWLYLMRAHPTLRFEDVDFGMDELELSYQRHELVAIRAETAKAKWDNDADRDQALASIDAQIEATPGDDEDPKAPSKPSA